MPFHIGPAGRSPGRRIEESVLASFLGDLQQREAEEVLGGASLLQVPAGATVLRPGETRLWLIGDGLIQIFLLSPDGRQRSLCHAVPGETIGLPSVFLPDSSTGARAVVESWLVPLDWERLRSLTLHNSALTLALSREVLQRWQHVVEFMATRGQRSVRQRIGTYLLELLARMPGAHGALPLTQQELADAVGASREAVARSLGVLRRLGLIATGPSRIDVLDPDGLRRQVED